MKFILTGDEVPIESNHDARLKRGHVIIIADVGRVKYIGAFLLRRKCSDSMWRTFRINSNLSKDEEVYLDLSKLSQKYTLYLADMETLTATFED